MLNDANPAAVVFDADKLDEAALRTLALHLCEVASVVAATDNEFVARIERLTAGWPADQVEALKMSVNKWTTVKNEIVTAASDRIRAIVGSAAQPPSRAQ